MLVNPWTFLNSKSVHILDVIKNEDVVITDVASSTIIDVIAVANSSGSISFFNSTGKTNRCLDTITQCDELKYCYTRVAWSPKNRLLVGGREDGQLSCWSLENDNNLIVSTASFSDKLTHQGKIILLEWDKSSSPRMASCDDKGCCCLWKEDEEFVLLPLAKFNKESPIRSVNFLLEKCARSSIFLFGTQDGMFYIGNEDGSFNKILQEAQASIEYVFPCSRQFGFVVVTQSLSIVKIQLNNDGSLKDLTNAKLCTNHSKSDGIKVNDIILTPWGDLIAALCEDCLRCWDLNHDDSYVIELPQKEEGKQYDECLSLIFEPFSALLFTGTRSGRLFIWRYQFPQSIASANKKWEIVSTLSFNQHSHIVSLQWGYQNTHLIAISTNEIFTVQEERLHVDFKDNLAAMKVNQSQFALFSTIKSEPFAIVNTCINIQGIDVDCSQIAVWSQNVVQIYKVDQCRCELVSDFSAKVKTVALHGEFLFIGQERFILVSNISGVQCLSIQLPEVEGCPQKFHVASSYLTIVTDHGYLRVMDISRKEPKMLAAPKKICNDASSIISVKCNANGTILSILSKRYDSFRNDSNIPIIFHMQLYDIHDGNINACKFPHVGYQPISHSWDLAEPRLLTCEIRNQFFTSDSAVDKCNDTANINDQSPNLMSSKMVSLFVTKELKVHLHTDFMSSWSSILVATNAPLIYFIEKSRAEDVSLNVLNDTNLLKVEVMNDFKGLENESPTTMSALLDFLYYITIGDINKAYISIQSLNIPSIWEKMAQVCVRSNRLDIAELALAQIGHVNGIKCLRKAKDQSENKVALAEVAIQLGMLKDAARLYKGCNRNDLLSNLLYRQNLWDEALSAAGEDSIQQQIVNYNYGKYLNSIGNQRASQKQLEKSGLSNVSIIKLILERENKDVKEYIEQSKDAESIKWYASYYESIGNIESSKKLYQMIGDELSLVRLACHQNEVDNAFALVNESNDAAAAYHLARHLEALGDYKNAVRYYSKSSMYNHAVRLCKMNRFDSELMHIVINCYPAQIIACAHYFEEEGKMEEAVELYIKGNDNESALRIVSKLISNDESHRFNLDGTLLNLMDKTQQQLPEEVLERFIKSLIRSGNKEKAIEAMIEKASTVHQIISISSACDLVLTEDIIDHLLTKFNCQNDDLQKLATLCHDQENYCLACRIFTQTGDRLSAIKSLLRGGETKRIISYASASRKKEIYVLSANYLQTLDWYSDQALIKVIMQFYSKAKAFLQLVKFLIDWSQYETSKHNYDRTVKLLLEAQTVGRKIKKWKEISENIQVKEMMDTVNDFLEAKQIKSSDPNKSYELCLKIIEKDINIMSVEEGDCYALLLQLETDFQKSYRFVQEMLQKGISPLQYVEKQTLDKIYCNVDEIWESKDDEDNYYILDETDK